MASPYVMRSRAQVSSPISNNQLFKSFEVTPRSASRRLHTIQSNKCLNISLPKCSEESTAKTSKVKAQSVKRFLSHPELSLADAQSNSLNESSVLAEKYRRSDNDFQRTQQNIHSIQNEQSLGFALNSSEREAEVNHEKFSAEDDLKEKKRDRSQKNWSCYGVPYRKCHSSMEEKVVSIINKIKNGKDCHKQIQTIIQKSKKVSLKELNNKFFVSGLQLLSKLAIQKEYNNIFTSELATKLEEALIELRNRILSELDNTKGFELQSGSREQATIQKLQLVRRAYKVLRKKLKSMKREEVQNKALEAADWFIENKVNDLFLFYGELAQC